MMDSHKSAPQKPQVTSTTSESMECDDSASGSFAPSSVNVLIAGHSLAIRSNKPASEVDAMIDYLNSVINGIREKSSASSTEKQLIIAALNITGQLFATRDQLRDLQSDVSNRIQNLIQTIRLAEESIPSSSDEDSFATSSPEPADQPTIQPTYFEFD